jgi:hypothetical protein
MRAGVVFIALGVLMLTLSSTLSSESRGIAVFGGIVGCFSFGWGVYVGRAGRGLRALTEASNAIAEGRLPQARTALATVPTGFRFTEVQALWLNATIALLLEDLDVAESTLRSALAKSDGRYFIMDPYMRRARADVQSTLALVFARRYRRGKDEAARQEAERAIALVRSTDYPSALGRVALAELHLRSDSEMRDAVSRLRQYRRTLIDPYRAWWREIERSALHTSQGAYRAPAVREDVDPPREASEPLTQDDTSRAGSLEAERKATPNWGRRILTAALVLGSLLAGLAVLVVLIAIGMVLFGYQSESTSPPHASTSSGGTAALFGGAGAAVFLACASWYLRRAQQLRAVAIDDLARTQLGDGAAHMRIQRRTKSFTKTQAVEASVHLAVLCGGNGEFRKGLTLLDHALAKMVSNRFLLPFFNVLTRPTALALRSEFLLAIRRPLEAGAERQRLETEFPAFQGAPSAIYTLKLLQASISDNDSEIRAALSEAPPTLGYLPELVQEGWRVAMAPVPSAQSAAQFVSELEDDARVRAWIATFAPSLRGRLRTIANLH